MIATVEYEHDGEPIILMTVPGFNELSEIDKCGLCEIDLSLQTIAEAFEYLSPEAKILVCQRFDEIGPTRPLELKVSQN